MRSAIRHFSVVILWIVVVLWAMVPMAEAQMVDVIPPSGAWVTDQGDMLSASEEQMLTGTLRGYADTTSTQIIIVTLPDLGGAPISDYAIELGQRWGVGQGDRDNGAVILVSRDDREVFIATGFGLEGAVPDVVASRIIRNIVVPNFRQGRVFAGLSGAVEAMMAAAAGEYTADSPPARNERDGGGGIDLTTIYILLIIAYFVITSFRRGGGNNGGGRRRRHSNLPFIIWGGGSGGGGWGGGSSGGFGGGGLGGFSGGGGGFGGGGAGGSW